MPDPSIQRFRQVTAVALSHLEERRQEINDLNVFPVADGDTGDNMALTMRYVLEELDRLEREEVDPPRPEIVRAVARAALMGARGNSGVILSQFIRGAAEKLVTPAGRLIDPELIKEGLSAGSRAASASVRESGAGDDADRRRAHGRGCRGAARPLARAPPPRRGRDRRRAERAARRDDDDSALRRRGGGPPHAGAARRARRARRRRRRRARSRRPRPRLRRRARRRAGAASPRSRTTRPRAPTTSITRT